MNRVKFLLPKPILKLLYYTLVYPHLIYCVIVWGRASASALRKLICVQKRAVRLITHSTRNQASSPIFLRQGILKLLDISKLQIILFMFKVHNNLLPLSCASFTPILRIGGGPKTRSAQAGNFILPQTHSVVREQSLAVSGPRLWNAIPQYLKQIPIIEKFKKSYTQLLINSY